MIYISHSTARRSFRILGAVLLSLGVGSTLSASAAPPKITLKPIDDKSLKTEIGKRKGKLVLVSMWSRSCPPCIAGYPELVKLARTYKPRGLEVLSINVIDDERTRRDWTLPFLQKQKPGFATFYENADDDEAFIRALNPKWYGGLPAEFLYDRNGKRILSMTENVDLKKLEKIIARQLGVSKTRSASARTR